MSRPSTSSAAGADVGSRPWLAPSAAARERAILGEVAALDLDGLDRRVHDLVARTREIHDLECINLNPATNTMNPRAEALLAAGLGSRPSLGHPGEKYETGLEAIEQVEVIAAELAARVFGARFAEIRVGSGALANLTAFMATCRPGDAIITPPPEVAGHVTHHDAGAAGLYGLVVHHAPVDADRYSVDVDGLAALARRVRPRLITVGGSLNLLPHPVSAVRSIADEVGADVLFDAAHVCGLIAGGAWPNPLAQGADLLTMSTYKSLGGPPGGLVLTDRPELAERIDAITYPGLTANFDASRTAALGITLLDWLELGREYADAMVASAQALAEALAQRGFEVLTTAEGFTASHQLGVDTRRWGDGQAAAQRLRLANLLACGIGMPGATGPAALRLGTNEVVRWGMGPTHMVELAAHIDAALHGRPEAVAPAVTAMRRRFTALRFIRP